MGAGLQIGQDIDFIVGAFFQFGKLFEFIRLDHLDGNFFFGFDVDGLENSGVHPSAELELQRIVLNYFPHLQKVNI